MPLICASLLLLARSFYVIYVLKTTTRFTTITTWFALVFMVGYWTWFLSTGGFEARFAPSHEPILVKAGVKEVALHIEGMSKRLKIT